MNTNNVIAFCGAFAVPKDVIIEQQKKFIVQNVKKRESLERLLKTLDSSSKEYMECKRSIEKCNEKIKGCRQLIYVMQVQKNLQTNARFRSF